MLTHPNKAKVLWQRNDSIHLNWAALHICNSMRPSCLLVAKNQAHKYLGLQCSTWQHNHESEHILCGGANPKRPYVHPINICKTPLAWSEGRGVFCWSSLYVWEELKASWFVHVCLTAANADAVIAVKALFFSDTHGMAFISWLFFRANMLDLVFHEKEEAACARQPKVPASPFSIERSAQTLANIGFNGLIWLVNTLYSRKDEVDTYTHQYSVLSLLDPFAIQLSLLDPFNKTMIIHFKLRKSSNVFYILI